MESWYPTGTLMFWTKTLFWDSAESVICLDGVRRIKVRRIKSVINRSPPEQCFRPSHFPSTCSVLCHSFAERPDLADLADLPDLNTLNQNTRPLHTRIVYT